MSIEEVVGKPDPVRVDDPIVAAADNDGEAPHVIPNARLLGSVYQKGCWVPWSCIRKAAHPRPGSFVLAVD